MLPAARPLPLPQTPSPTSQSDTSESNRISSRECPTPSVSHPGDIPAKTQFLGGTKLSLYPRVLGTQDDFMMNDMVFYAGATQLGIALSSLFLPRILDWRGQTAKLDPLTKHVFWTYACYIFGTNLFFAGISMLAPHLLTDGTTLARTISGFITTYWGARVLIQIFAYRAAKPKGWFFVLADWGFLLAFMFLTFAYGMVTLAL
ncbi:MAG: hypothetical protein ACI89X_003072 [Planctomycetota bacterium]|jgi:hypothetical protein